MKAMRCQAGKKPAKAERRKSVRKRPAAAVAEDVAMAPKARARAPGTVSRSRSLANTLEPIRRVMTPGRSEVGSDVTSVQTLRDVAWNIMTAWELIVGAGRHQIVELEAYAHSSVHPDPYTHGDDAQLDCGKWYFHKQGVSFKGGSFKGLDLTCGSREARVYAGLLVRSIVAYAADADAGPQAMNEGCLVEGPSLVVDHILKLNKKSSISEFANGRSASQLPADATDGLRLVPRVDQMEAHGRLTVHAAPRVGLVLRMDDGGKTHSSGQPSAFCTRPYRFSVTAEKLSKCRSGFVAVAHLIGHDRAALRRFGLPARGLENYVAAVERGRAHGDYSRFVDKKDCTQAQLCELAGACDSITKPCHVALATPF